MTITEKSIYTTQLMAILREVGEDETITYEAMNEAIGLDVRPNKAGYCYQKSARDILERDEAIAFEVEPKIGLKRLTPEQVAQGTGSAYREQKISLLKRSKRRISTVNDHYDGLSPEAKIKVTAHRTILAFDHEIMRAKNIRKIEGKAAEHENLIGFDETLKLFAP